jgi:hypothetical protein
MHDTVTVEHILKERQRAYGEASESFQRIATLWGDVLGIMVTPQQVAACMIMLKVSRLLAPTSDGSHDEDSVLDIKGYATLRLEELG